MIGLGLGIRKSRAVAASPSLVAGIASGTGGGDITLTGNATNGTAPYSYAWTIAGPDASGVSWPEGWEWAANAVLANFAAMSVANWTGIGTGAASGNAPSTLTVVDLGEEGPLTAGRLQGGYYGQLQVTDSTPATANATISFEAHDEGVTVAARAGVIAGNMTFDVTVTGESDNGGGGTTPGEIAFSNIMVPANATHWVAIKLATDQSVTYYVNEAASTTFTTGQTQGAQDYLFVIWAFGPGRNSEMVASGPHTVTPFP